jgi:hypothetical protein
MIAYNVRDVEVERELYLRLPPLPEPNSLTGSLTPPLTAADSMSTFC